MAVIMIAAAGATRPSWTTTQTTTDAAPLAATKAAPTDCRGCAEQPTCLGGEFLKGSGVAIKGTCVACANSNCAADGKYQTSYCGRARPHVVANVLACPAGTTAITTQDQCRTAATTLGKKWEGPRQNEYYPRGCVSAIHADRVLMNSHITGKLAPSPAWAMICMSTGGPTFDGCLPCANANCPAGQYRSGTCSSASNGYTCAKQPTCAVGLYLKGSSNTAKGTCAACATTCAAGSYMTASCRTRQHPVLLHTAACPSGTSGISPVAKCREAAGTLGKVFVGSLYFASWPNGCLLYGGKVHYKNKGTAGIHSVSAPNALICIPTMTTTPTFDGCKACSNANCDDGHYRSGTCGGNANGYMCTKQPTCSIGQFLMGKGKTNKGKCVPCAANCAAGKYQTGHCGRQPHLVRTVPCPAGTSTIMDQAACRAAAKALGKPFATASQPTYPRGCYYFQFTVFGSLPGLKRVVFNTHATGDTTGGGSSVSIFCIPASGPSSSTFDGCRGCANATCAAEQYRSGVCTTATAGHTCTEQPTCPANQFLKGATKVHKGSCTTCSNTKCPANQYRSGVCSGTSNGFECGDHPACTEGQYLTNHTATSRGACADRPTCPPGQYLQGSTTTTTGQCTTCSNMNCGPKQYRTGTCNGIADRYACSLQPTCTANEFLVGWGTFIKGTCNACRVCPAGRVELLSCTNVSNTVCDVPSAPAPLDTTQPPATTGVSPSPTTGVSPLATSAGVPVTTDNDPGATTEQSAVAAAPTSTPGNQSLATGGDDDGDDDGGMMLTIIIAAAAAVVICGCIVLCLCMRGKKGADAVEVRSNPTNARLSYVRRQNGA